MPNCMTGIINVVKKLFFSAMKRLGEVIIKSHQCSAKKSTKQCAEKISGSGGERGCCFSSRLPCEKAVPCGAGVPFHVDPCISSPQM